MKLLKKEVPLNYEYDIRITRRELIHIRNVLLSDSYPPSIIRDVSSYEQLESLVEIDVLSEIEEILDSE